MNEPTGRVSDPCSHEHKRFEVRVLINLVLSPFWQLSFVSCCFYSLYFYVQIALTLCFYNQSHLKYVPGLVDWDFLLFMGVSQYLHTIHIVFCVDHDLL